MRKFKPGDQVYIKSVSELKTIWKTDNHGTIIVPNCVITPYMQKFCDSFDTIESVHPSGCPLLRQNGYYWPRQALVLVSEVNTDDWAELF